MGSAREGHVSSGESSSAFAIVRRDGALHVTGALRIAEATRVWHDLRAASSVDDGRLDIDLREARIVDGAIMSLLVELRAELAARGIPSDILGASDRVQTIVHLYGGDEPPRPKEAPPRRGTFRGLRDGLDAATARLERFFGFVGELVVAACGGLVRPVTANWRAVAPLAERAGIDGVPIVLLLNFLVGFVMAYQSAHQLKTYGANIYVADVVGISVTRELAPLMTAIIMSGRSGAAFAAELGAMKVSEELDALRTLGFSPQRFLILPRIIALALVAPVLTLLGDVVGVAGGAAVGVASLDISAAGYVAELRTAVVPSDVGTGLAKSIAFGIAIAFIGCQQGFATSGGAAGVGRRTTATVVVCLFVIVIIDTLLTMFFRIFGE